MRDVHFHDLIEKKKNVYVKGEFWRGGSREG